jgi:hypothetical protein
MLLLDRLEPSLLTPDAVVGRWCIGIPAWDKVEDFWAKSSLRSMVRPDAAFSELCGNLEIGWTVKDATSHCHHASSKAGQVLASGD